MVAVLFNAIRTSREAGGGKSASLSLAALTSDDRPTPQQLVTAAVSGVDEATGCSHISLWFHRRLQEGRLLPAGELAWRGAGRLLAGVTESQARVDALWWRGCTSGWWFLRGGCA